MPRRNTISSSASSGRMPVTAASALYSPTEWPHVMASSTKTPASRISATWATARVAIATWVNWVRKSTPSGWRCSSPSAHSSVGLSRTTARIEKPRASRVWLSARSQTSRAAAERDRASRPMPWLWMPWPGKAYVVRGAATTASATIASSPSARQVTSTTVSPPTTPVRSTVISTSAFGSSGATQRVSQLRIGRGWWVAPTDAAARCATAESHMPCTIGPSKPARRAAASSVCSGLWSPLTAAKAPMWCGAVTVNRSRRARGLSSASGATETGAVSSAAPVRPRTMNRSSSVAISSSPALMRTSTEMT